MENSKQSENRGGRREGAGRKPSEVKRCFVARRVDCRGHRATKLSFHRDGKDYICYMTSFVV